MHILIKWYYWYKNLGDELILFSLLNRIEDRFEPQRISIECGNKNRLESWILKHKTFLIPGIISKIEFLPKPSRKEKIQLCLWMKKWIYDFIIFGGWEVVDESRNFLYRWRNLLLQYKRDIKHWRTALVWWLWTNQKFWTRFLQKFLIKNANFILVRDQSSFTLVQNFLKENNEPEKKSDYIWDLSLPILQEALDIFTEEKIKTKREKYYLINYSPLCNKQSTLKELKKFSDSHKDSQPIYIACKQPEDETFFSEIQSIIPNCECFDWTQNDIAAILKLFYFAESGIWARLHFLYILKFFKKPFIQLHNSHKIKTNLSDLDQL